MHIPELANPLVLYHGSDHVIERPVHGAGRLYNDFGRGFYCSQDEELAREWAATHLADGFANRYELDTSDLVALRLDAPGYCVLHWLAVLVAHRTFRLRNPVASRAMRYLMEHFAVNVEGYDLIIGWRADDSYFDFADGFLNNAITVQQLASAMRLGNLGEQIVLKSARVFEPERLKFCGASVADRSIYAPRRSARNDAAVAEYERLLSLDEAGLYIADIIREGIRDGDPRIP